MRIGFIGLGDQGGAMAEMILRAGFDLAVWARRPEVMAQWCALGAGLADGANDLAAASDILCLCVTGDADVTELLLDRDLLGAMRPGSTVAVHATIRPSTCAVLARHAAARGVNLLDAPVSGSGHAARTRSLLVMAGGEEAVLDRARPVFAAYAGTVLWMGEVGAATTAKLINNLLAALNIGHAVRALELGCSLGFDPALLRRAVLAATGRSFAMEAVERFCEPTRAAHVAAILRKDVALALEELPAPASAPWASHAWDGVAALEGLAQGRSDLTFHGRARSDTHGE
jgi:3-hydroxyisobutyrate dehydrogenase-like beta-hydroxyacid dehydrogenase